MIFAKILLAVSVAYFIWSVLREGKGRLKDVPNQKKSSTTEEGSRDIFRRMRRIK